MVLTFEQENKLCKNMLTALGMSESDAELLGSVVTFSDFIGVYSHGLSRFTMYVRRFQSGAMNVKGEPEIIKDNKAVANYDCKNASGVLAACKVYDQMLERAKDYGIAFATGMNSSNIGCGAYYGWRSVKDNVILMLCCNTFTAVAPFGGADSLLGTNPIIVSVPAGKHYPMVMDISTSVVAMGKIQAHAREGKDIPLGWANDSEGRPTTDSRAAHTVLPIAAHKGYGLGVMVDVVSALLSGALYGNKVPLPTSDGNEGTGFAMAIIDIEKFMDIDTFKASTDEYIDMMKNSKKAEGFSEIFMPGEMEYRQFDKTKETGYEVTDALAAELVALGIELGIAKEGDDLMSLCK